MDFARNWTLLADIGLKYKALCAVLIHGKNQGTYEFTTNLITFS